MTRARKLGVAAAVCLGALLLGSRVDAITFTETFDDASTHGWVGTGGGSANAVATGGVGNTGFLQVNRASGGPQALADSSADGGAFVGNLQTKYGTALTLSFYAEAIQATFSDLSPQFRDSTTQWIHDFGAFGGTWTFFSMPVNTAWSDAQANAAGWTRTGAGTDSWATVITGVTQFAIDSGASGSPQAFGLDSITLTNGVPEPGSLALLALGGLGAWRRARRRS